MSTRPPSSQRPIRRAITVAGTHAITAPEASYAVDFSRLLENAELLPPAAADCTAGKIDEHGGRREFVTKTENRPRKRGNSKVTPRSHRECRNTRFRCCRP